MTTAEPLPPPKYDKCHIIFLTLPSGLKKNFDICQSSADPPPQFYFLLWQNATKIGHFMCDFSYLSTKIAIKGTIFVELWHIL